MLRKYSEILEMHVFRLVTKRKAENSTSQIEKVIRSYERVKLSDGSVSLYHKAECLING